MPKLKDSYNICKLVIIILFSYHLKNCIQLVYIVVGIPLTHTFTYHVIYENLSLLEVHGECSNVHNGHLNAHSGCLNVLNRGIQKIHW